MLEMGVFTPPQSRDAEFPLQRPTNQNALYGIFAGYYNNDEKDASFL
jgi:hypothetical protein